MKQTCLVAKPLAGDDGDLIAYTLVGLEVERQFGIVALDDDLGGFLDGLSMAVRELADAFSSCGNSDVCCRCKRRANLCPDATHDGGCWIMSQDLSE